MTQLAKLLNFGIGSASKDRNAHWEELQKKFSSIYPSSHDSVSTPLEGEISRRIELALARMGVSSLDLLQLCSGEEICGHRSSSPRGGIGSGLLSQIEAFLKKKGKSLRNPSVPPIEAAKTVFGKPAKVPVGWLVVDEALHLLDCQYLLIDWGILCLGDLTRIPRESLSLLGSPNSSLLLGSKLPQIEASMKKMKLKPGTK